MKSHQNYENEHLQLTGCEEETIVTLWQRYLCIFIQLVSFRDTKVVQSALCPTWGSWWSIHCRLTLQFMKGISFWMNNVYQKTIWAVFIMSQTDMVWAAPASHHIQASFRAQRTESSMRSTDMLSMCLTQYSLRTNSWSKHIESTGLFTLLLFSVIWYIHMYFSQ